MVQGRAACRGASAARCQTAASVLAAASALWLLGCGDDGAADAGDSGTIDGGPADAGVDAEPFVPEEPGRCDAFDALRRPFFGDLHVHTSRSLDAVTQGTRLTPAGAYRFARGEAVGIQPYAADGTPLRTVQLDRPLDFAAVTDHAEFLGEVRICETEGLDGHDTPLCRAFREDPDSAFLQFNVLLSAAPESARHPAQVCGDGSRCSDATMSVWREIRQAAEDAYDMTPACSFTSFVGYEWSASPGTRNLHRNVLFRNRVVPAVPVGYFEEPSPERLWAALQGTCLDVEHCDVLTIPHNSNLSSGLMFEGQDESGAPFSAGYAAERQAMEPLIEIFQHKGDSECLPGAGTEDELCEFEKLPFDTLSGAMLGMEREPPPTDFVRSALGQGLSYGASLGVNPFRYGIIASTDTHIGTPGLVEERDMPGHGGAGLASRTELPPGLNDYVMFNPGGLAVLWAEENTREALFLAMRRREAYGTSGPRIVLRFFGGWAYPDDLCDRADLAARGYEGGVPMGGSLPPPAGATAPRFVLSALRDPGTARIPGVPLQRAQVIKGWLEGGAPRFQVFDVAGDATLGTVDTATCEVSGEEFDSLCTVWIDPAFDPITPAFYYARVVEAPSCRWTTFQCNAAGVDCTDPATVTEGFEGCCDPRYPKTVQERAWSSPIWFDP